jgi:hypothetical protein
MLTNWSTLKERIEYLKDLEQQEADNTFDLLTKKEAALRRKELKKLRQHLDGIKTMETLPDIAIVIDQKREMTAIRECRKLGIPIVSILDTNCDPDLVDIPIPGNDDAVRSIKLILKSLTDSIIKGKSDFNFNCETDFVARRSEFTDLAKNVAMQIASNPEIQIISIEDISEELKEKAWNFESAKEDLQNKPEDIKNKIVEGRVNKSLKKQVLLEQEFIRDPSITVNEYIKQVVGVLGENIRVRRFTRYELGETDD